MLLQVSNYRGETQRGRQRRKDFHQSEYWILIVEQKDKIFLVFKKIKDDHIQQLCLTRIVSVIFHLSQVSLYWRLICPVPPPMTFNPAQSSLSCKVSAGTTWFIHSLSLVIFICWKTGEIAFWLSAVVYRYKWNDQYSYTVISPWWFLFNPESSCPHWAGIQHKACRWGPGSVAFCSSTFTRTLMDPTAEQVLSLLSR